MSNLPSADLLLANPGYDAVFCEVLMNVREALYLSSTVLRQSYQVRQATIQKAQPD